MNGVSDVFQNRKVFIPFVTAGDPNLKTAGRLIPAMTEAGADLVEIGVPFSDPITEGIAIQGADMWALASDTTTDKIFGVVRRTRERMDAPLAFMTCISPIFVYEAKRFLAKCKECGVDALIMPDMPFEEEQRLFPYCHQYDIELISLTAPTSKEQIAATAREAEGFVYYVSSMGVTGVRIEITTDIGEMVSLVKKESDIPRAVGFGISTPGQAEKVAASADGVIVGSAIVHIVTQYGTGCIVPICDYVKAMRTAIPRHGYKYIIIPTPARLICR